MGNLLSVGTSALLANSLGLQTTGNNITNANVAGYSRQRVVLQTVVGQYSGSGYVGQGVQATTIQRSYDSFLTSQAASAQSMSAMDTVRSTRLAQLEDLFKGGKSGLGAAVSDLLNAFSDVSSSPTDATARNVVVARADEMTSRFRAASTQLSDLQSGVRQELTDSVKAINSLADRISAVNQKITQANGSGQQPNDLLDQRDQLMRDLGQLVQTSQVTADDGSVSVFIGSQALVLGNTVAKVSLANDEYNDLSQMKLAVTRGALTVNVDEQTIGGGSVAGLLRFNNSDLAEASNLLGRMALAINTSVNAQHELGVNSAGQTGTDLFTPITLNNALSSNDNTGTAVVSAAVADSTKMVASDYQIEIKTGGAIQVTRLSDGQQTNFAGPLPVAVDGLTFDTASGAAAVGDRFLVKPFSTAASKMAMEFTTATGLAVGSPVQAAITPSNTGSVTVNNIAASSSNANLTQTVTLTFTGAGTFDVSGTGTGNPTGQTYTSGQPISYNGWSVTLQGTPKVGDTVTIQIANPANAATNVGNAKALLDLRDVATFDGVSMTDGYSSVMATIGVRSQSAQYATSISSSIATSLESNRTSVSGVNLDEEAAKLLQYQQAYQASSKVIQISQNIFDSLMSIMR